jgi:hypothetical protein
MLKKVKRMLKRMLISIADVKADVKKTKHTPGMSLQNSTRVHQWAKNDEEQDHETRHHPGTPFTNL